MLLEDKLSMIEFVKLIIFTLNAILISKLNRAACTYGCTHTYIVMIGALCAGLLHGSRHRDAMKGPGIEPRCINTANSAKAARKFYGLIELKFLFILGC